MARGSIGTNFGKQRSGFFWCLGLILLLGLGTRVWAEEQPDFLGCLAGCYLQCSYNRSTCDARCIQAQQHEQACIDLCTGRYELCTFECDITCLM